MARPTINEVAALAGVSKGTVSRVLNGRPDVSARSRQAVEEAIAQSGYRRNGHAHSLATGQAGAIALLMSSAREQLFTDPTYARLIEGIYDGMAGLELNLVLLVGGRPHEDARIVRYVQAGHVDGLIHLNQYRDDPILQGLAGSNLPLVLTGPRPDMELPPNHAVVSIDDKSATESAIDYLTSTGAERIATISGDPRGVAAQIRLRTYRERLAERLDEALIVSGDYSYESGYRAMQELFERRVEMDALFCASDRMAAGAIDAARQTGLRVPEDLRVVGFDDQTFAATNDPPLTTVHQPIRTIGSTAVSVLRQALQGGGLVDRSLPTELIIRQSA